MVMKRTAAAPLLLPLLRLLVFFHPTAVDAFRVPYACPTILIRPSAIGTRKSLLLATQSDPHSNQQPNVERSALMEDDVVNGAPLTSTVKDGSPSLLSFTTTARQRLELPWNDAQEWALRDKLSKYTVLTSADHSSNRTTAQVLWRNLVHDTPELAGYPLPFLVERLRQSSFVKPDHLQCGTVLPYLDNYSFKSNGGLSGRVYGLTGVADGTTIQTTAVGNNVDVTLRQSFVQTTDGTLYELGQPKPMLDDQGYYRFGGMVVDASKVDRLLQRETESTARENNNALSVFDPDLVNLGGLTALLVGGAWAVGALAHHLTVNVFWV